MELTYNYFNRHSPESAIISTTYNNDFGENGIDETETMTIVFILARLTLNFHILGVNLRQAFHIRIFSTLQIITLNILKQAVPPNI